MVCENIVRLFFFSTLVTFSESQFKKDSKCGHSYDQEVISEICKPKFCGIRTWNVTHKDEVLSQSKLLTKLIFDHDDGTDK
jgi:hypothetical protein